MVEQIAYTYVIRHNSQTIIISILTSLARFSFTCGQIQREREIEKNDGKKIFYQPCRRKSINTHSLMPIMRRLSRIISCDDYCIEHQTNMLQRPVCSPSCLSNGVQFNLRLVSTITSFVHQSSSPANRPEISYIPFPQMSNKASGTMLNEFAISFHLRIFFSFSFAIRTDSSMC